MNKYTIHAILPWVRLGHETAIDMGPVRFCRASEFREYLESDLHENFEACINKEYVKVYARVSLGNEVKDICIRSLNLDEMMCVALDEMQTIFLSDQHKDELIFDSVQFLCFLSNLGAIRNSPYALINNLRMFLKIGRINKEILNNKQNWSYESWFNHPGRSAEIFTIDKNVTNCLGKILLAKFLTVNPRWAQRITKAVHYYNRIFMGHDYEHIVYYGSLPEDIVFLSMAFESLLDVQFASNEKRDTSEKFRHTLQNIFNIKHDTPRQILNKWIREFYNLRSRIVHGDELQDQIFHENENIDIPYINLGMKIFVAALICDLAARTCLESGFRQQESEYIEDFYIYLWPQIPMLNAIKEVFLAMKRDGESDKFPLDNVLILHDLERVYMGVYYERDRKLKVKQSNEKKIATVILQIIHVAEEKLMFKKKEMRVMNFDNVKVNNVSTTEQLLDALKSQLAELTKKD